LSAGCCPKKYSDFNDCLKIALPGSGRGLRARTPMGKSEDYQYCSHGDHFPDHMKFPDFSSRGKKRLPGIECLPIWSTVVVSY